VAAEALTNELRDQPKDHDADLGVWQQLQLN
jgi:hypothetical protein